ncbi:MAG: rRNA maturation RNase YbeY [Planctomycetaceae bacterium]|nr:rRNA maturation RNase YbeY [Planctomycetaceae bacterium]
MPLRKTNISVEFDQACKETDVDPAVFERLITDICANEGAKDASISIRFVDDKGMIEAHRRYLGQSTTTDVMSFDLSDEFEGRRSFALIVNAQLAKRQAARRGHSLQAELALYIAHGLLHMAGYDDADARQAEQMHRLEDLYLERNQFGRVYFGPK